MMGRNKFHKQHIQYKTKPPSFSVRRYIWNDSGLEYFDSIFSTIEDALDFCKNSLYHKVHIKNHNGEIVYSDNKHNCNINGYSY